MHNKYYIYDIRHARWCVGILLSTSIALSLAIGYIWGHDVANKTIYAATPPKQPSEVIIKPVKSEVVEEVIEEPVEQPVVTTVQQEQPLLSKNDVDLIALVTMAEAEGEPEMGKRLVIDTILNRVDSDRFPDTVRDVIYAKNAFECMWNGRVDACYVKEDIRQLVLEEMQNRTRNNIHYFRAGHYHNFGTPVINVGNHYFSTY